jgi:hypothetical protein
MTANLFPIRASISLKDKQKGVGSSKALLATAHKLMRVIFAMLFQQTYFQTKMEL